MQDESDADGADGRRRSVPLFDPVAGMRAMADIQAEGLRAASDLLERVLAPDQRRSRAAPAVAGSRPSATTRRSSTPGPSCCSASPPGWLRPPRPGR